MTLENFEQHQQVERATTFIPGRAVALTVFAVALVVDLLLLTLVWTHVLDGMPEGVQGLFLVVMLGSFLAALMSWKADKIVERIDARLPELVSRAVLHAEADTLIKLEELCADVNAVGDSVEELRREFAEAVAKVSAHAAGFPAQVGKDIAALAAAVDTLRRDHDELSEEFGGKRPANVTKMPRQPSHVNGSN